MYFVLNDLSFYFWVRQCYDMIIIKCCWGEKHKMIIFNLLGYRQLTEVFIVSSNSINESSSSSSISDSLELTSLELSESAPLNNCDTNDNKDVESSSESSVSESSVYIFKTIYECITIHKVMVEFEDGLVYHSKSIPLYLEHTLQRLHYQVHSLLILIYYSIINSIIIRSSL